MKTVKDWKKEVDKVLTEKVASAIKDFQAQRDSELQELAELNATLENREAEKERMTGELGALNALSDQRRSRELYMKLRRLGKEIDGLGGRRDAVFSKLTTVPKLDFALLNFLSNFKP
jgi:hypothetical protein